MIKDFLWSHVIVPYFWFIFEFVGDRPWLWGTLVLAIILVAWQLFSGPIKAFHTLFGWKGWALLGVAAISFGSFGAGWRAHRDASIQEHKETPPPPKKKEKEKKKRILWGGLFG